MPSNIHKKLVYGALGCGGLLVVLAGIGLLLQRSGLTPDDTEPQTFTSIESAAAWDSLSATSMGEALMGPPVPTWPATPRAQGVLFITPARSNDYFPLFGDTFPPGSLQRKKWMLTAQRVGVRDPSLHGHGIGASESVPAGTMFFRARILLAAADDWSRHGDRPEAVLALDSALGVARAATHSENLVRLWMGARIERDAMELLWRDTLLAGSAGVADRAGQAVAPLGRFVSRLRTLDRWIAAVGADPAYADSLATWVADSTRPLTLRTAAVRAIGMGWVYNAVEPGMGLAKSRQGALQRLRTLALPDSVTASIDLVTAFGTGFTERFGAAARYRAQRLLLFLP